MKSLARSYVWWPQIDMQIKECTKRCSTCQVVQNQPPQTLLHPWIPASKPMERIHIDFAGPFEGILEYYFGTHNTQDTDYRKSW